MNHPKKPYSDRLKIIDKPFTWIPSHLLLADLHEYIIHLIKRAGSQLRLFEPADFQATKGLPIKVGHMPYHYRPANTKIATEQYVQRTVQEVLSCSEE